MKNPNGYGSVVKLSGKRRRPYAVRKTVGWDERAYPIYKIVGYYPTRKEAMIALAEYNASPYDLDTAQATFQQLYERWEKEQLPKLGTSLANSHRTSYKYCEPLYERIYRTLRKPDFQRVVDSGKSYGMQVHIRNLLKTLDAYAYDLDVISKQYTEHLTVREKEQPKERSVFTDDEVRTLFRHRGENCVDETILMIYTGMRVSEMLALRCDDIDMDAQLLRGGGKTAAGKNRIIPIHPQLLPIISDHIGQGEYLFNHQRNPKAVNTEAALQSTFLLKFKDAMSALGMVHTTHECRHTFRTKLDAAGANGVSIDILMGHKSQNVGERVYTHKTIAELQKTVFLLDFDTFSAT